MKKAVYIFLCSLMGALLFLILHRVAVFFYLVLMNYNYSAFSFGLPYWQFLALDYFTLILALLLGGLYGIWVGLYWYEAIYEHGHHGGFVHHVVERYWPTRHARYDLKSKITQATKKIEGEMWELEDLAKHMPVAKAEPVKRRVARKKT